MDFTSLCSNPEKCFCWLIILLDIFAIFYLVFVSFYKVTRLVRMIGWIWIGVLITADIIILAIHPCVLTLLCILFTIMIMAAMLSVVLPNAGNWEMPEKAGDDEKPKKKEKCGSYVVREIDPQKYCFELYDPQNRLLVRSLHCYLSVGDVKQAIASTRESGEIAEVEDRTVDWIKEVNHPKFELFKDGAKFRFQLSSDSSFVIFRSKPFASLQECKKQMDKTIAAVASLAVYISVEKLSESEAKQYADANVIGAENAEDASAAPIEQAESEATQAKPADEAAAQTPPAAQPKPEAVAPIDVRAVTATKLDICYDPETGFLGPSMRGFEPLFTCSSADKLLLVWSDGRYKVVPAPEKDKVFVDKDLLLATVYDRDRLYTCVYTEKEVPFSCIKRFAFGGVIQNRDYSLLPEPGTIRLLEEGTPPTIWIKFRPAKGQRILQKKFDPSQEVIVKGVRARGKQITTKPISAIAGGDKPPRFWDESLATEKGGLF